MKLNKNKITLAVCFALSLSACSPNKTVDEYIASAKAHISNNKSPEALIELKNAVRSDVKNPEVRALLGSLYLQHGEAAAAEKELQKALMLGSTDKTLITKLLKSLELQGENDESIELAEQYKNLPAEELPGILLYKALAYTRLGDKEKAIAAISEANEISADSVYSRLGNAYIDADSSNTDDALSTLNSILEKNPDLTEALILQGQLLVNQQDYAGGINAFKRYFTLLPADIKIRLYLANAYIKNKQFDEAEQHVDSLLKVAPEHAFSNQLKGLVYYQRQNYKLALMHTEKAIQNGMNTSSNRVVAGLSAFNLKEFERAHQFLVSIADSLPSNHPVQRALVIVQIQLGYNIDAGESLRELDELTSQDVKLFTVASFKLIKEGKIEEARALLSKTDGIVIDNPEDMTKIGILKISMDDLEGLTDLEKSIKIDSESAMTKIALATSYIINEEYEKALNVAKQWKESSPEDIEGYNLAAKVYLLQKKADLAEIELEKALAIDELNSYSLIYLATKSLNEKKPEKAIELLEKLLDVEPNNITALSFSYFAHKAVNRKEIAINKIVKAYESKQGNTDYKLLYAKVLFSEKDFEKVIDILKDIANSNTIPAQHWGLLADSYVNISQNEKALDTTHSWITAQPLNRNAYLKNISMQENLLNYNDALSSVEKALEVYPADDQFNILRAYFQILTKNFSLAQKQIDKLSNENKLLPLVAGLQAQIWLTEGHYKRALPGLKGLYEKLPTPYNTALVFETLKQLNQKSMAFDFIKEHVKEHAGDNISRNWLAEIAMDFDLKLSKNHYLVLFKLIPNDMSVLNNFAWVEYQLENYEQADILANRAVELYPNHPQVLDTAGLIKLKLGANEQAISLLKKASVLAPNNEEIRKHYQDAAK
jgi:putative PEP-CTERM system TPR-repeat lipoprotein